MMEFVPLRSLQRGLPEVWQTLRREDGRIVLTSKGQPAYLLVDLAGQNVVSLINLLDEYRSSRAKAVGFDEKKTIAHHSRAKDTVKKFLADAAELSRGESDLTNAEWDELENIRSQTNLAREIDL
jgi:hypothetical protein